jgi:uncharacterized membrane protein
MPDREPMDTAETNDHIHTTVRSIAELRSAHEQRSTGLERVTDAVTQRLARPVCLIIIVTAMIAWMAANVLIAHFGAKAPDPPPFFWLEGAASVISLCLVILVLSRQRREDELDRQRDLLSLELAILAEQKTAKIIELLEELRRDSPQVPDRIDSEADQMAKPSDTKSVIGVIQESRLETERQ